MKPKGRNLYEQQGRAISRDRYQVARANINCARNRVQELVVLGRRTQSIQTAIRNSHILATLERDTRDLSAQRLSDFADDLLSKLLELEQEIVIKNERSIWEKDLRLIFVSEAIALSERAKLLDEAELSASYDQLTPTRSGAVTNYHLGREGLNACLCDVLHYESEDELRRKRTEEIFDAGGFSSYITANTRAKNLIAAERFAELIGNTPFVNAAKTSDKSNRKKSKRRKK